MADEYKLGDLVWAKMKGFTPWPGKVIEPQDNVKKPSKKHAYFVYFFGSENYAWIEKANMKPYFLFKKRLIHANRKGPFKDAVDAIEKHIQENEIPVPDLDDVPEEEETEKKVVAETTTPKTSRKRTLEGPKSSSKASKPRLSGYSNPSPGPPSSTSKTRVSAWLDRPSHIQKPDAPAIDMSTMSQTLKDKKIEPSGLKFGFLGLGIMGSGIVKNLVNTGHSVMVWNRSFEKCDDFVEIGAKKMMTPSDVISAADITFSCVADPQAAKSIVFGNCGVLQEMTNGKGYVEMTGIDSETSQDIAESISGKGGRYLEAQLQGSRTQTDEGTLVILAAGDRTLFDDCQSCFQAMGKNSFYLGEVGNASKMYLVLQVMAGITMAGLSEGMALADRAGLQQADVLEIMELTSLSSPLLVEKSKLIIDGSFSTQLPLKLMQKDLKLGMLMGDNLEQPLPLTATTNEVFKHAKRLGYSEHDVSSVYIRTRF